MRTAAVRAEIRTGVSDGQWIEVTSLQRPTESHDDDPWVPVNGLEQVILGDLSALGDGAPVEVVSNQQIGGKVASEPPLPVRDPARPLPGA